MNIKFSVLLIALFSTSLAHADPDPSSTPAVPGKASHQMPRVKVTAPDNDKGPVEIKGYCSIVPSASNPMEGPCVNLVIVMNHEDGTEFVKNRTTAQGAFSFEAESGQKYQLALGSKLYEIVSPKGLVQAGQKIDLRLQQK